MNSHIMSAPDDRLVVQYLSFSSYQVLFSGEEAIACRELASQVCLVRDTLMPSEKVQVKNFAGAGKIEVMSDQFFDGLSSLIMLHKRKW